MDDWIFGALIAGAISGAIPMFLGASKNKLGLGFAGFMSCIVSALILGLLLAIPVSGIFVWLISKNSNQVSKENQKGG
ncbi:hypothetical protein BR63_00060 [Thermanaerosceptrum fracticalcis]|uniref:Uncharacterized protein n=1 Tax=Thermanaerosceptrum fracticalcis TaxID=1712410 RepID=A0A7G6DYF9_THEFR|nr:hypothetical protein [Thermanaerosceptrum fracticalcis]QNB44863.1 hypothetical protein BR63_00060 [Thermanaerosceptrum fracticalcis]